MNDLEFVFDIEGDSLNPTKIYCLVVGTTKGVFKLTDYEEMKRCLLKAEVLVGHNIIRWDTPVLERILGIKIKAKLVDTLALSWYLQPKRPRHNLESYGEDFGIPKPKIDDWENLPLEEYVNRCTEDVRINTHLWNSQYSKLIKLYEKEEALWKFLDYISFKMHCTRLQEESGWKLDVDFTKEQLDKLEKIREEKVNRLSEIMPRIPVYVKKNRPKVWTKKDGSLSAKALEWQRLLAELSLPENTDEVTQIKSYDPPNPGSVPQIKQWLFTLGWKPQTFKHKDGREIPQINLEQGKGVCPSIKKLFDIEPELEVLDGLSVLTHRISILQGFVETVDEKGYVKAQIQGLTNTLRFQHSLPCVNLPRSDRPYAEGIRGSLIAPDGYELCGADLASLEDKLKQHYIYPYDPDYVNSMDQEDYDAHLNLALSAGMLTEEQVKKYKSGEDKSTKPIRDIAKNGTYACQFGAYPKRLVITCGISLEKAKELFDGYWKLNWAIKVVAEKLTIKYVDDEMWQYNPVSKFWYSLRKDADRFSTLIQGTASFVFDKWVEEVIKSRQQLTGQYHDEFIICVKEGFREEIKNHIQSALDKVNKELNLNKLMTCGISFGKKYSEVH